MRLFQGHLGVHTGDSGGGLITVNERGEPELTGVLSAADNEDLS